MYNNELFIRIREILMTHGRQAAEKYVRNLLVDASVAEDLSPDERQMAHSMLAEFERHTSPSN